jgi:hypothetical protein
MWQNQKCRLTLHYENGFTLTSSGDNASQLKIYWHYPYDQLRASSDDSNRLLWLDFGEEGEVVTFTSGFTNVF